MQYFVYNYTYWTPQHFIYNSYKIALLLFPFPRLQNPQTLLSLLRLLHEREMQGERSDDQRWLQGKEMPLLCPYGSVHEDRAGVHEPRRKMHGQEPVHAFRQHSRLQIRRCWLRVLLGWWVWGSLVWPCLADVVLGHVSFLMGFVYCICVLRLYVYLYLRACM